MNNTNEEKQIIIDGKSEIIITHSKKKKINDILLFILWTLIGSFFIVVGILLKNQSLFLRILSIIVGSILIISFFESFLVKLTNKIILNPVEIRMRNFFRWNALSWDKVSSIELDTKSSTTRKNEIRKRITIMKINGLDDEYILYPLFKFTANEADNIVDLIKGYYKIIRNIDLDEIIIGSEKEITNTAELPDELEERLDLQIPLRVEEYEIEEVRKEETE
ncbi:MAG TPA: hypothetical protein VMX55_01420 [candidate division Zixibacteria bacterium]|nr:hypothetical protein [candidate division Zixibacteria bacterium]